MGSQPLRAEFGSKLKTVYEFVIIWIKLIDLPLEKEGEFRRIEFIIIPCSSIRVPSGSALLASSAKRKKKTKKQNKTKQNKKNNNSKTSIVPFVVTQIHF